MSRPLLISALFVCLLAPAARAQDAEAPATDDVQKRTERLQKELTELRGLKFRSAVEVGVYNSGELEAFLRREMEKEYPREKADRWQKAYAHFGLIPKELDLYESVLALLGSSIEGFYHPRSKQLRLVRPGEDGDPESRRQKEFFEKQFGVSLEDITFIHELCHAAQDQNFELGEFPIDDETNDDLVAALKAVIEGDASIVGWQYGFKDQLEAMIHPINEGYKDGGLPGKAGEQPAFLRKTLTFPYGHGADFVYAVWRNANFDWSAVTRLFQDPPTSTEQILDPKKYYGAVRDHPVVILMPELGGVLGPAWKEVVHNVHGEYVVRLLLGEFKAQRARELDQASQGWDGDRYYCFENGDRILTVWFTTWDSDADAKEFFESYDALLAEKYPGAQRRAADQKVTFETEGAGRTLLERRGMDVLVIEGADGEILGKANRVWSSAKKADLRTVARVKLTYVCPQHADQRSAKPDTCYRCGGELKQLDEKKGK